MKVNLVLGVGSAALSLHCLVSAEPGMLGLGSGSVIGTCCLLLHEPDLCVDARSSPWNVGPPVSELDFTVSVPLHLALPGCSHPVAMTRHERKTQKFAIFGGLFGFVVIVVACVNEVCKETLADNKWVAVAWSPEVCGDISYACIQEIAFLCQFQQRRRT